MGGMRREPAAAGAAGAEEQRWLCPAGAGEVSYGSPGTPSPGRGVCNALSVCTSSGPTCESRHLLVFWNPCPMSPKSCFSSRLPGSPIVFQFLQYLTSLTSWTSPTRKAPTTTRPGLLLSQATFLQVGSAAATYKRPFLKPLLHLRSPPCFHIPSDSSNQNPPRLRPFSDSSPFLPVKFHFAAWSHSSPSLSQSSTQSPQP